MSARGGTILNQGIRNGFTKKIIFKQRPQRSDLCRIIIGCTCCRPKACTPKFLCYALTLNVTIFGDSLWEVIR